MGGRYPHGLVIGQITEVHQQDIEAFQHATVRPSVNFRKLESVLVITSFEPLDVGGALDAAPESTSVELTPETTRTP
jgi:cell shape-determining protein MreC